MRRVRKERPAETMLMLHDLKKTRIVILQYLIENDQRLTQHTKEQYIVTLHQFFKSCRVDYDQVIANDIRAWISTLEDQTYKSTSIYCKLMSLKSFYRFCIEEKLISDDPTLHITHGTRRKAMTQKNTDDLMWQRYDLVRTRFVIQDYLKVNDQWLTQQTKEQYTVTLYQFFKFSRVDYDQVIAKDIGAWLSSLEAQRYKMNSIYGKLKGLKSFYRYCMEKKLICDDPILHIIKENKDKVGEGRKDDQMWERYNLGRTRDIILNYLKDNEHRLVKHTTDTYLLGYHQFFETCMIDYDQVTAKDITAWLGTLDEQGQKINTLRSKLMGLKSFYLYCMEEGLLSKNPTLNIRLAIIRDHQNSRVKFIEKSTVTRLMELTRGKLMEQAIITTLYTTGVRIGELVHIKLDDIDYENRQIMIRQGKGKKDRLVLFTVECAERLKDYTATQEGPYLFSLTRNKPLSQGWVREKFQGYTLALKADHSITPHTMRHTFASRLAQKNMPIEGIQVLLGHEDIRTTLYYARLNVATKKKQYDFYQ